MQVPTYFRQQRYSASHQWHVQAHRMGRPSSVVPHTRKQRRSRTVVVCVSLPSHYVESAASDETATADAMVKCAHSRKTVYGARARKSASFPRIVSATKRTTCFDHSGIAHLDLCQGASKTCISGVCSCQRSMSRFSCVRVRVPMVKTNEFGHAAWT